MQIFTQRYFELNSQEITAINCYIKFFVLNELHFFRENRSNSKLKIPGNCLQPKTGV